MEATKTTLTALGACLLFGGSVAASQSNPTPESHLATLQAASVAAEAKVKATQAEIDRLKADQRSLYLRQQELEMRAGALAARATELARTYPALTVPPRLTVDTLAEALSDLVGQTYLRLAREARASASAFRELGCEQQNDAERQLAAVRASPSYGKLSWTERRDLDRALANAVSDREDMCAPEPADEPAATIIDG